MKNARRFRPVTLLEVLHKACKARVSDRLLDVIEKHELLHKCQYTFLRNGCIATPIEIMNIGALPRRCRPQVMRVGTTVRFILKAPYLGGLTGARPHLGSSACQAQGSQKLWTMKIWHCKGMILRCCEIAGS